MNSFIDIHMKVPSDGISSYIFQQSPHEIQNCVLIG